MRRLCSSEAIELDIIKEVLVIIERLPKASSGKVSLSSSSQYLSDASLWLNMDDDWLAVGSGQFPVTESKEGDVEVVRAQRNMPSTVDKTKLAHS